MLNRRKIERFSIPTELNRPTNKKYEFSKWSSQPIIRNHKRCEPMTIEARAAVDDMLMTPLCCWLFDGDIFDMLVAESLCWWLFEYEESQIGYQDLKVVTNKNCLQYQHRCNRSIEWNWWFIFAKNQNSILKFEMYFWVKNENLKSFIFEDLEFQVYFRLFWSRKIQK